MNTWRGDIAYCLVDKPNLYDAYQFGVYIGSSVADIKNVYDARNIPIRKFFCFDSYEGLPKQEKEPDFLECWKEGNFNATKDLNAANVTHCIHIVDRNIKSQANFKGELMHIGGFFKDSLYDEIVQEEDMRPARFIDIDVDIYESTYDALDFMFRNGLVGVGTLIAYDDWGGSPGWENFKTGESRAHWEITNKYGAKCSLVRKYQDSDIDVHMLFMVEEFG